MNNYNTIEGNAVTLGTPLVTHMNFNGVIIPIELFESMGKLEKEKLERLIKFAKELIEE